MQLSGMAHQRSVFSKMFFKNNQKSKQLTNSPTTGIRKPYFYPQLISGQHTNTDLRRKVQEG